MRSSWQNFGYLLTESESTSEYYEIRMGATGHWGGAAQAVGGGPWSGWGPRHWGADEKWYEMVGGDCIHLGISAENCGNLFESLIN
jgi:hypothetical protein